MAQTEGSTQASIYRSQGFQLRAAGLFLRRKAGQEFHTYISILNYNPDHYEVLLRKWPREPFFHYLAAFSGPVIAGEDPQTTLLRESQSWSINLAAKAGVDSGHGLEGRRALFLSVQGGGAETDPVTKREWEGQITISYVIPVKHIDSSVVAKYPTTPDYPHFCNLGEIIKKMIEGKIKIHPHTRQMLSSLDHWLHEEHALPGAINALYSPSLQSRIKMCIRNPLLTPQPEQYLSGWGEVLNTSSPTSPLLSSTPFRGPDEDSTLQEATAITLAKLNEASTSLQRFPVDMIVKNPLFGSGLTLEKANRTIVNKYFGKGIPNYEAASKQKGKWVIQVQGDGLPDWTELYPMHKFACAGDADGVMRCIQLGISPDERDSDTWSPLHYACWYGELGVVKVLVKEAPESIAVQNSSGSTPLHLAAATGHKDVVTYLLKQKGIGRLKAALDNDGKSPLAVCLECKMNDWERTEQLLREAYKNNTADDLPVSAALLSFSSQPTPSVENLLVEGIQQQEDEDDLNEELDIRGSLRNIDGIENRKQTVRRHRVNFMSGHYRVAHFFNGRETSAGNVIQDLYRLIRMDKEYQSLFALWIMSRGFEIQLGDTDKPLKLMSTWKKFTAHYKRLKSSTPNKKQDQDSPAIYLRRNVFYPVDREKTISDCTALEFLYADAQNHVLSGYYPCSEDDSLYLASITMQILYGDYNPMVHKSGFLKDALHQVLPHSMVSSKRKLEFERRVLVKYAEMTSKHIGETKLLQLAYLKHCRQWKYYGAIFFDLILHTKGARLMYHRKLSHKSELQLGIGINTLGFHFVNRETNVYIDSLSLDSAEWDVSKNEIVIYRKDHSVNLLIHTKQASLIHSLITRMVEQYTGVGAEGARTSITST